jgi:glycosyl transferase family 2
VGPTASVVICAYTQERWEWLKAAVASALDQTPRPVEVIVVVDHNPALAQLAHEQLPSVSVVQNAAERGLSGARNTGVAASHGEVVAFLDDDAAAEPGWLAGLLAPFDDADVMASGGVVEPIWHSARPGWFPAEFDWVIGCSFRGQSAGEDVRNPLGASMAIRRRVFQSIGGFHAAIGRVGTRPVGDEETELGVRIRSRWPMARVVMRDDSVARHHVPETRATVRYFLARCWAEGRSKAILAGLSGGRALDTEREYTRRALPRGVKRNLRELLAGDTWGAARATAIAAGLAVTVAGFAAERGLAVGKWRLRTDVLAAAVLFVVAAVLWITAVPAVNPRAMNDLGLISALPLQAIAAIGLLSAGAVVLLRAEPLPRGLLGLHLVALVVMLNAIPVLTEEVPRFGATWLHAGFADYIMRTGGLAPGLDARFNWPGFFILAALLTQLGGLASPLALAGWATVYFNLLFALPLAVLFRGLVRDERLVWAGLWVFYLANWIGQDYWAPQALGYFFFLVIIGVVVTCLGRAYPGSTTVATRLGALPVLGGHVTRAYMALTTPDGWRLSMTRTQAIALLGLLVVIFGFVAMSHEVTPFFIPSALLALVVADRLVPRTLPILFGVIAVTWVSYMTVPFLAGHAAGLLSEIGRLGGTVTENITSRVTGSAGHELTVRIRLLMTVALSAAALIGAWRRFRARRGVLTPLLLALSPIPLVALQSYGGEVVLRLYLFSLPFVTLLAAGALYGVGRPGARASVVAAAVCGVLAVGFFTARYGNERSEAFTTAEVTAVEWVLQTAPPGSLLVAAWPNLPWMFQSVERFTWMSDHDAPATVDPQHLRDLLATGTHPARYLVLTRSEGNYAEAFEGGPRGVFDAGVDALMSASTGFRLVYRNADAAVFVPAAQATGAAP